MKQHIFTPYENLIKAIYHYKTIYQDPGHITIITMTDIAINSLLIDSKTFSVKELSDKIVKEHPNINGFAFNIQYKYARN